MFPGGSICRGTRISSWAGAGLFFSSGYFLSGTMRNEPEAEGVDSRRQLELQEPQ